MSDFMPSGAIELRYITSKTTGISPFEQQVIQVAHCNQKDVLELEDFYADEKCSKIAIRTPAIQKEAKEKFESYRKQVIASLVKERIGPIVENCPKFDIGLLVDFLAANARGVVKMSEMLNQLVGFLKTKKEFNENGTILLAFLWTTLYRACRGIRFVIARRPKADVAIS